MASRKIVMVVIRTRMENMNVQMGSTMVQDGCKKVERMHGWLLSYMYTIIYDRKAITIKAQR